MELDLQSLFWLHMQLYSLAETQQPPHPPAFGLIHCNENPIYVNIFWELRGLRPNFHIHESVSDLCIPMIGLQYCTYFLQQNRQIDCGSILMAHRHMNVEIGTWPRNSFSRNICFEFSVLVLCSVYAGAIGQPRQPTSLCDPLNTMDIRIDGSRKQKHKKNIIPLTSPPTTAIF